MNLQHYLWKDVIGYNLHPAIPVRNDPDLRIADVGTGTGSEASPSPTEIGEETLIGVRVWLVDLSRQLPSAHLDGFDISDEQFPPKQWLPAKLSLQTLDVFSPIPDDLVGKYDIVHVRLFVLVVRNDDPTPILRNLTSMLS